MENNTIQKTIHNEYGEDIHIKKENGKIYIFHTDCSSEFEAWEIFIKKYIISQAEFAMIVKVIYELVIEK